MHFQRLTCCTRQPEHPDDLRHCGKGNIPYGTWLPATVVLAAQSLNQTARTSVYLTSLSLKKSIWCGWFFIPSAGYSLTCWDTWNKPAAKQNPGIEYLVMFLLLPLGPNGLVVLGQKVGELLIGRLLEHRLLPQVGGEEGVGLGDGGICSFS